MRIKCVLVLMMLFFMVQAAYAIPIVKIDPDWINSAGKTEGSSFQADVKIENVDEFSGFSFDLEYDSSVLSLEKIELGDFLESTGGTLIGPKQEDISGEVTYEAGIFGTEKPSGGGILASLTFSVNDPDKESLLELAQVMLSYKGQIKTISHRQIFNSLFGTTPIYYSINVISPEKYGTITPSSEEIPEKVIKDSDMIFIFTPNSCYEISDVTVNGNSVLSGDSNFAKNADGTANYSLKDIQKDYSISASFSLKTLSVNASATNSYGTISPSGTESLSCGSSKDYTIMPSSGYRAEITGGLKNNNDGTYTLENITEDQNISVTFKLDYGNINGDSAVDLKDAVLALKLLSGVDVGSETISLDADVNNDGKIGMEEVIYILRRVSEI